MALPLRDAASVHDLAAAARRRLPRFVFNYLDGGAGEDAGVARNVASWGRYLLKPRRFGPVADRTAVSLFGRSYAQPFGIAPMGMANFFHPGADLLMAALAQRENVPYVLSTAGSTAVEAVAAVAPDVAWFQLYLFADEAINADLVRRAWEAGLGVLVLTVDVPLGGRRNRSIRDRYALPIQYTPRLVADLLAHPGWSVSLLRHGRPTLENYARYAEGQGLEAAGRHIATFIRNGFGWDELATLRDRWKGRLVVKGIMLPEDAERCVRMGADGIWVSNHGGRQLESAPASVDAVAPVRAAVGSGVAVLADGGVRSGEDIIKARALGADLAFAGRPFGYAAAAAGAAGLAKAFEILSAELRVALTQIGCPDVTELGPGNLAN